MQNLVRYLLPSYRIINVIGPVVLFLALILPLPLWSQSAGLSVGAGAGLPGQSVTVDISLTGGAEPAALQWRMNYASADLNFAGAQPGASATQATKFVQCEASAGEAVCILFGFNTNSLGDGVVAAVTFQILATATPGTKGIGLSDVSAVAGHGGAIVTTASSGAISVEQIVNLPPVASDSGVTTTEDTPVNVSLVANDPEGGAVVYSYVQPANGSVTGAAPAVVYTPGPNFHGQDQFSFQATDNQGQSDVGTVTVTVQSVNDPPVATDQNVTTDEDTPRSILLSGTDPDGDTLTFVVQAGPTHGTLAGTGANLTYTPKLQFNGQDEFTFRASDSQGLGDNAKVVITVLAANDPPSAIDQNVSTTEDSPLSILLSGADPDGNPLSFTVLTQPSSGTLSGASPNLTYTPNHNFHGGDSFTFEVADEGGTQGAGAGTGLIQITVQSVNDAPVAEDQFFAVPSGLAVPVTLAANDVDGDVLAYQIESGPSHGALSGTAPALTYTPEDGYAGQDSFVFRAVDPNGSGDSAIVTLAVEAGAPQNGPPKALSQDIATDEDIAVAITFSATDPDGDALTFSLTSQPASGTVSGEAPTLLYTPTKDFHGIDSLAFTVSDGNGHSDEGAVGISVNPVNDSPTTSDVQMETEIGNPLEITLEGQDADDDPLTFVVTTGPSSGSLSGTAPDLTYTPYDGFAGTDSFDFLVSDTGGESVSGTVSITVSEAILSRDKPAAFTGDGVWMIDQNADGRFDGPPSDREFFFSSDDDNVPVVGDWSGSGQAHAGIFINGSWYLDLNQNGVWDGAGVDVLGSLGQRGDIPVVGDWDGSGRDNIGVFRGGKWLLDWNGNGLWDGPAIDRQFSFGGRRDLPVVGDWLGDGRDRIGVFGLSLWRLDWNGNGSWNGTSSDRLIVLGSWSDTPIIGDWNGSGSDKVGVYRSQRRGIQWQLDRNGNGVWDGNGVDVTTTFGGRSDQPVVGDWDGTGADKIGVFDDGTWLLDYDGDGVWGGETVDRRAVVGGNGDKAVNGRW